jgi:hypothetical protein
MKDNTFGKKYGLIAGVGMIAYFLLFYVINKALMMSLWVSWSALLILIICLFLAIKKQREANKGVIEFKDGLRIGFLVVVLGNALFYLFFFLLLKFDTELVTILKEQSIAFFKDYAETDQQQEELIKSYENYQFGFSELLSALGRSIIGGFFLALLGAFVLKRKGHL